MARSKPTLTTLLALALCLLPAAHAPAQTPAQTLVQTPTQKATQGRLTGGAPHAVPGWFKESFLEIQEDVDEATAANKHVILFFQLNDCPYCDRMLTESFEAQPLSGFIREHFDVIAINVRGDREVAFDETTTLSEKQLSALLKVQATPAILFLDRDNNTVARVNGYRSPQRFRQVLRYVQERAYEKVTLAQYLDRQLPRDIYTLRDNTLFQQVSDLSAVKGPLAVIFEDGSCYDCAEFHDKLLSRADVQQELRQFTVVRLDADADQAITGVSGTRTTPRALAQEYEMTYRPGVLIFDNRKLIRRYDSLLFSHHFKEGFRYVSGGHYKTQSYGEYSAKRTEELLSQGIDIDLAQ
jgi:thioredoxin-related protein